MEIPMSDNEIINKAGQGGTAGQGTTGQETAGQGTEGQETAGQGTAEQREVGLGAIEQVTTGQVTTGQDTHQILKGQIWSEDDYRTQIVLLENYISIFFMFSKEVLDNDIQKLTDDLNELYVNFLESKYNDAEKNIIDIKKKMYEIINKFGWKEKFEYYALAWGFFPIGFAIIAMIVSFYLIIHQGSIIIILGVPLWASCIAVVGASVQILIGVVNDYKEDYMVTDYNRIWYVVLPFVSFVFGFLAFLSIKAGLISTLGNIAYNQSASVSTISALPNSLIEGSSIGPPAFFIIACFLAGYATNWFIGLLKKYTYGTQK